MPTINFRGRTIECDRGTVLRDALLAADETPHNGATRRLNCGGRGTCGTCAVRVDGPVTEPTRRERMRLSMPPHSPDAGLRLACQTRVQDDLTVEKFDGAWGQRVPGDEDRDAGGDAADSDG